MSLDVSNIKRSVTQYAQRVEEAADVATKEAAQEGMRVTKSRTPVDTGRLKGSIQLEGSEGGYAFFSTVPYAPHVEWGTRHMGGSHMFKKGAAAARKRLATTITKLL